MSIKLLREIEQGAPCMAIDDQQLRAPPVELRTATTTVTPLTIVALRAAASGASI
jgi:hypothetical protein